MLLGGVLPDLDGVGLPIDLVGRATGAWTTDYWGEWHHEVGHNLGCALLASGLAMGLAAPGQGPGRRAAVGLGVFVTFHLQLLGDLVGARGPDGDQWPIPWLRPFSEVPRLTWAGQWALDAWPNILLTAVLLAGTLWFGWRRGRTPLELVSPRADLVLVDTLRRRLGAPAPG